MLENFYCYKNFLRVLSKISYHKSSQKRLVTMYITLSFKDFVFIKYHSS